MRVHTLATQLRRRQYGFGQATRQQIDALPDRDIIDCYITCNHCGKKQVEGAALDQAIREARDAEDFFRICNERSQHGHYSVAKQEEENRIDIEISRDAQSRNDYVPYGDIRRELGLGDT